MEILHTPYEGTKELQRAIQLQRGRKPAVKSLLVLAPNNDPFYAGSEADQQGAEWFMDLWERFGYVTGVHLRRVHYRVVSEGNIQRPNGTPYENNLNSWQFLNRASRAARYLGLLDPEDLVDKRNPTPHLFRPEEEGEPDWYYELRDPTLERLDIELGFRMPPLFYKGVRGYEYNTARQPYHVEVWAEKTTMDDILEPLCSRSGVNYISGAGYQSITAMVTLLRERVGEKPTRILYISDYDSAGQNMPRQVSRQIEFWTERYSVAHDLRVEPIVLTAEQANHYPAAPDSGAVELDAMEALDPGKLARIVSQSLRQFQDHALSRKFTQQRMSAISVLEAAVFEATEEERSAVEQVHEEAREVYARYQEELEDLAQRMDEELEPLDERLEVLQRAIEEKLEDLEPELPPLPEPEAHPDDGGWLYDSRRDYLEQLEFYKRSKAA
jgi:hypothetical protein